MTLLPGFGLVVAPFFQLDVNWQERLTSGAGVEQTSLGLIPRSPWRAAEAEDLGVLIASPPCASEHKNDCLCLFNVPLHLRSSFWKVLARAHASGAIAAEDFNSWSAKVASFLAFKELCLPAGAVFELVMNTPGQTLLRAAPSLWGLILLSEDNAGVIFLNIPASDVPDLEYPPLRLELAPGEGLRVPAGYALVRVSSSPDELVAYSGTAGGVATVDLARPLTAGQSADLTFEFRGPALAPVPPNLPFPVFAPIGASERIGVIGVFPGPLWAIDAVPGAGTHPAGWLDLGEPRVPGGASAAFRYRGGNPEGTVTLSPVRAEFTADAATRVVPVPGGLIGTTTFAIRVRAGGLTSLMVVETEGGATGRAWRVLGGGNAVAAAASLPAQSLAQPLGHAAGWPGRIAVAGAALVPGRVWLVRFARPVTGDVTLETTATRSVPAEAETDVLRELTDSFGEWVVPAAMKSPDSGPPIAPQVESRPAWSFSGLYLVSAVRSPSDVIVVFGGTVNASAGTSLPIQLPAGAQVRAAGVGGRWMEPGGLQLSADYILRLPVSAARPVRFEVRYRLPVEAQGPVGRVRSPRPELPVDGAEVRRWWVFAADVLPGWPILAWDRGTPADLPAFLGDSPTAWAGGLSCRKRWSKRCGSGPRKWPTPSGSRSRPCCSRWRGPAPGGGTRSAGC